MDRGNQAAGDFVGWTGLPPTAVLFEYVYGLRPDVPNKKLTWDIRLLEAHGVSRYPFGLDGLLDLSCEARADVTEMPIIKVETNVPITLEVIWAGGSNLLIIGSKV